MVGHLGETKTEARIVAAIESVLSDERVKTPDLGGKASTADMAKAITAALGAVQPA